jgi:hypothetical protein
MAKPRSRTKRAPAATRDTLEDAQARLEADVGALGKQIEELQAQIAERRSMDAAVAALLMLRKRRPKAKAKTTRRPKAGR